MSKTESVTVTNAPPIPIHQQLGLTVDERGMLDIPSLSYCLVQSGFFPTIQKASQAIVKIMLGKELGIGPMQAVMNVHVIVTNEGTSIMVGAHTVAGKIKGSGKYDYEILQYDDKGCELQPLALRKGEWIPLRGTVKFTVADGLKLKGGAFKPYSNWSKDPTSMCFARCVTRLQKVYFPDLTALPVYTPDELGFKVNDRGEAMTVKGEPVKDEPLAAVVEMPKPAETPKSRVEKFSAVMIGKLASLAEQTNWSDAQALQMMIWEGAVSDTEKAQTALDALQLGDIQALLCGDDEKVDRLIECFAKGPDTYLESRRVDPRMDATPTSTVAKPKKVRTVKPVQVTQEAPKTEEPKILKEQYEDLWAAVQEVEGLRDAAREFIKTKGYANFRDVTVKDLPSVYEFIRQYRQDHATA